MSFVWNQNLPSTDRRRLCGKDMRPRHPQTDTTRCQHCGAINLSDERICSVCRRVLTAAMATLEERYGRNVVFYERPDIPAKPRTKAPIIGGILLLVVGLGSLGLIVLITLLSALAMPQHLEAYSGIFFTLWILVSFMLAGAVAAFKRVWWPLAAGTGAALLMTFIFASPFCLVFTGVPFVALLLIVLSRREFS